MKVRYISTPDPTDDKTCTVFGQTFDVGKWVDVDDSLAGKLAGNPTFEVKGAKASTNDEPSEPETPPEA